jgi:hypothetical protein
MRPSSSLIAIIMFFSSAAFARAPAASSVCQRYPSAAGCGGGQVSCTLCHTRVDAPPAWNPYGLALKQALGPVSSDEEFSRKLGAALDSTVSVDSDGDGASNQEELNAGTLPGDPASVPKKMTSGCDGTSETGTFNVCGYDAAYALRKVMLTVCGRSPTSNELRSLPQTPGTSPAEPVVSALDTCVKTEHWRGPEGVLDQLAHPKIRPTNFAEEYGGLGRPDFAADYALFAFAHIDGHDSRDLLRARYFVQRDVMNGKSVYRQVKESPKQLVPEERRAGMVTTRWFLLYNNMFTALPRTAAAQAYRAYLGVDISKNEGLFPVSNEPKDYDRKGIAAPQCAVCHSTLDPLSYPFSRYDGVSGQNFDEFGRYLPNRLTEFYDPLIAGVSAMPEKGSVLGKPVDSLVQWAEVAANSDQFARSRVLDFWKIFMHRPPQPEESASFQRLVERFKSEHQYAVEPMLRDLVQLEAFGAP